jgi:hypothetical protein
VCSVSWRRTPQGYELVCNRDERRTRAPELPPLHEERRAVRYLAPGDGQAGGTWIAVNELGLALCLLNAWTPPARPGPYSSRGALVRSLADARSCADFLERARSERLERYPAFTLLALAPHEPAALLEWDGEERRIDARADARRPLISSSFAAAQVRAARLERWRELAPSSGEPSAAELEAFHASHARGPSAYSVCMHREDAQTRSSTRVRVTARHVEMDYGAGAPCEAPRRSHSALARCWQP